MLLRDAQLELVSAQLDCERYKATVKMLQDRIARIAKELEESREK